MKRVAKVWFAVVLSAGLATAQSNFYLHSGDRVVFYGDSITDQRLYTVVTEAYTVTRYPQMDVTFVHSGWGGDKVSGGAGGPIDVRLKRDVLPYKPTAVTIMLGMNDGLYKPETEANDKLFIDGYRHIVDTLKSELGGVRITAIKPSPYDDVTRAPMFPGGYNQVLISFSKWIGNYAASAGLQTADLNTGVVDVLEKARELDPDEAKKIIPDRVHPGFSGHLIMAEQLLKAWSARPTVAAVTIDSRNGSPQVASAEHAKVSGLAGGRGLTWTQEDDALPLPFAEWEQVRNAGPLGLVLRSSDVAEALGNEPLRVTGLKDGIYTLTIDGETVGSFNNEVLAKGINLGLLATPMSKQAKQVYDLVTQHVDVHQARWRQVQVPLNPYELPKQKPTMEAMDDLEKSVVAKLRETAQPKAHKMALTPIG